MSLTDHLPSDLLAGRAVFVTGGGSGINLGIAKAFSAVGANLTICGRTADKLEHAAGELRAVGAKVCVADVRDEEALRVRALEDPPQGIPTGSIGTVYFERDSLPFQYHNDPEKTSAAQHPDHPFWTTVGDLGYVDDEGFLYLADRRSFMIISGGVNIYPQEVENALALHPAVQDVAVIGVPDAEMGEQVKAVVELAADVYGSDDLARELIDYARKQIAHYKAPRTVDFVDQLPRTPAGKLVKGPLRDHYLAGAS